MTLMKPVSTPSVLIVLASNVKFHAPFATSDFFSHISSKLYQMCVCVGVSVRVCVWGGVFKQNILPCSTQ